MADLIGFRAAVERIFVCECGCSTFELWEGGSSRCAACGGGVVDRGSWYLVQPDLSEYGGEEGPVGHVQGNGSVDFSRRRVSQIACTDDTAAIVVVAKGGSIHVWAEFETKKQKAWMLRRLGAARALIVAREVV